METIYYFVDETIREQDDYLHCNIGGTLVPIEQVVDIEIALETQIYRCLCSHGIEDTQREFKFTDFYRGTPDNFKLELCSSLVRVLADSDVHFLVSHAKIMKRKLNNLLASPNRASNQIQLLAQANISTYLKNILNMCIVQIVVDLGISEAFLPTYKIYAGGARTVPMLLAAGYQEDLFTINFRNLPTPLFLDSKDSRILQFSDFLIGLLLCQETNQLTSFKDSLLSKLAPIMRKVQVNSIEWNKDDA